MEQLFGRLFPVESRLYFLGEDIQFGQVEFVQDNYVKNNPWEYNEKKRNYLLNDCACKPACQKRAPEEQEGTKG